MFSRCGQLPLLKNVLTGALIDLFTDVSGGGTIKILYFSKGSDFTSQKN